MGMQGVRYRLHAGDSDRHLHGVSRGCLRRVLQLRAAQPSAGKGSEQVMTASHASETDSPSETHSSGWVAEALREHDELARQGELLANPHDGRTKGSPQPLPGTVREEQARGGIQ